MSRPLSCLTSLLLVVAIPQYLTADDQVYDVVIYGATSAGVVAAVQAIEMGKTAVVLEPGKHIGGLTSGGLGWTDSGNKNAIGGLSREFYQRIKQHYDKSDAWKYERPDQYDRYRPEADTMWTFEPRVAEQVYQAWIDEHQIPVHLQQPLKRENGVTRRGQRITSITTLPGKTFQGRMFIDATYEGDLLAAAGVSFVVGRESNAEYDETLNGVQKLKNMHSHLFLRQVDPYVIPGQPDSGLLPGVHGDDPGQDGSGDHRIQAYCFRMCMSNVPRNRVPFPKPAGYDAQRYELLLRNFEAGDLRLPFKPDMMPNGKTDTNNNCAFSTDNIGMNYDYPTADYQRRDEILREHETYQKGLMWTLANHPRVPATIRHEMSPWGLAKDEFVDNGNWPHQVYVREARRMVSDYVVTEQDCRRQRILADPVGLGSYNMDSHNTQRYVTEEGYVQNEGDIQESPGGAYLISYRSIIPKQGECQNLLVPVCLSASHIAYGSIRMEPVFMVLGQSAATAAVIAIDGKMAVQQVPYQTLRARLLADDQVLDLPLAPPRQSGIPGKSLPGIVIDDDQAVRLGTWLQSSSVPPFVEVGYRHDNNVDKGNASARFPAELHSGRYEVRIFYSPHSNRATKVPVAIQHAKGTSTIFLNQRVALPAGQLFVSVGEFQFDTEGEVVVSNRGTDGFVIVDAVQFVPVNAATNSRIHPALRWKAGRRRGLPR